VGERSVAPPKGEMELVGGPPKDLRTEQEGVEKPGEMVVEKEKEGVDMPKGPKEGKVKKVRARVRFGGEEELGGEVKPEVEVTKDGMGAESAHDHAAGHDHTHSHKKATTRPEVLHDRPDLYEF